MRLTLKVSGAGPLQVAHRDVEGADPAKIEEAIDAARTVLGGITREERTATRLGSDRRAGTPRTDDEKG